MKTDIPTKRYKLSELFQHSKSNLVFPIGRDEFGNDLMKNYTKINDIRVNPNYLSDESPEGAK